MNRIQLGPDFLEVWPSRHTQWLPYAKRQADQYGYRLHEFRAGAIGNALLRAKIDSPTSTWMVIFGQDGYLSRVNRWCPARSTWEAFASVPHPNDPAPLDHQGRLVA